MVAPNKLKMWFSFENNGSYDYSDQVFFNLNEKWSRELQVNTAKIRTELDTLITNKDKSIVPYFNKTLANSSDQWTIFPLLFWGQPFQKNQTKVPLTSSLINKIPGVVSASFSMLDAQTTIKPHVGDSNTYMRCHLGLKIPSEHSKCKIEVKGIANEWKEGAFFAFCDAQEHIAYNKTNETRWILIIDVMRPEFLQNQKWVCSKMKGIALLQFTFQKFYIWGHFPKWARAAISNCIGWIVYVYKLARKT